MTNHIKIALAQLSPKVGDVFLNSNKINSIRSNLNNDVDILVLPELFLTGYPIDDLVLRNDFLSSVEKEVKNIAKLTVDQK